MIWRKRMVRVHMRGEQMSVEGVLTGRKAGHYVLENAKLIESPDVAHAMDGGVWIPCDRVLLVQTITT